MKTWIGALLGIFLLWGLALIHLTFAVHDLYFLGFHEDDRWYSIMINTFFFVLLGVVALRFRIRTKTKFLSLLFFGLSFSGMLLALGMEGVIFGIFGSPNWENVQRWAAERYPEKTWVQEPFRVSRSACGAYCLDVHAWEKIRRIIFD